MKIVLEFLRRSSALAFLLFAVLFGMTAGLFPVQKVLFAIFFFVFSRILLPRGETTVVKFIKNFTLEKGLIVGVTLALVGCSGLFYSFFSWMQQDFGNLIPAQMMRVLIPAFTCVISGVQVIFASFFASLLTLYRK